MLDGIIDRMKEIIPGENPTIVATGGNAPVIVRYCRNQIIYDKYLLMEGLQLIYLKNREKLEAVEHPMMKDLKAVLQGKMISGYPTLEDINEKAELYDIHI